MRVLLDLVIAARNGAWPALIVSRDEHPSGCVRPRSRSPSHGAAQARALSGRRSRDAFAGRRIGYRGDGVEVDEQMAGTSQGGVGPVGWRVRDQAGVYQPAGERGQRNLGLDPGERGAEAVVDAVAEADVGVVGAV